MSTSSQADDDSEHFNDSHSDISTCSSQENSSSQSEDSEPESDFSGTYEEFSDSEFQPENQEISEVSDDEQDFQAVQDTTVAAPKQGQKKNLQCDPKQGDNCHQHFDKILRLMKQAENNGKICYLGPPVGWDEEKLHQYLKSVDEEIPDAANMIGKPDSSNSM
jgi:hypothetical protein